jgi:hypothetical protein
MRRFGHLVAGSCALLVAFAACERAPRWPDEALLVGDRQALARLLDDLQELEGTPLARAAEALARDLPPCDTIQGRAAGNRLPELLANLGCGKHDADLARLERLRGARDLAVALPGPNGEPLLATLELGAGGTVDLELQLPDDVFNGAERLLVPSRTAPGPVVLSGDATLLHARVRAHGGVNLADLVSPGGQADTMFRLRSALFAGAVLDGTWEVAIYLPAPDSGMPRSALALGFTRRAAAVAAMEQFVDELRSTWPVHRSDFAVGDARGACLLDLNLMPELAPCYVASPKALVVGWNPASLRTALESPAASALGGEGGAIVDLSRFGEADARLSEHFARESRPDPQTLPWQRLSLRSRRNGGGVQVRARLEGSPSPRLEGSTS